MPEFVKKRMKELTAERVRPSEEGEKEMEEVSRVQSRWAQEHSSIRVLYIVMVCLLCVHETGGCKSKEDERERCSNRSQCSALCGVVFGVCVV